MKRRSIVLFLLALLLSSSVIMVSAASNEALIAADALHQLGLFNGTGDDALGNPNYELDRAPTRTEALVMLIRALGKEDAALSQKYQHPFADVDSWADPYVGYAYQSRITNGVSATQFGANSIATSNMYLTFMLRALGYSDTNNEDFSWSTPFALAKAAGILPNEVNQTDFLRSDVALVSYNALFAKIKNSDITLLESLVESGAVNELEASELKKHSDQKTESSFDINSIGQGNDLSTGGQSSMTMDSVFSDVPDYTSVTGNDLFYSDGNTRAYLSTNLSSYISALNNAGFTKSSTYVETYADSSLLTAWGNVSLYTNASGRNVHLIEIVDNKISSTVVLISIDKEIKKPIISSAMSELVVRQNPYEDPSCIYKNDYNNYSYGYMTSVYSSPIYVQKANVKSPHDLGKMLSFKYDTLYSPMGDLDLTVEVRDKSTSYTGQSINVLVDFGYVSDDYDVITPLNFDEKYGYTDSEKRETISMLEDMMREIYSDVTDCFPNAKVSGCIYIDGYKYRHIKVGHWSETAMSWDNSNGYFQWTPDRDTIIIY